MQRLQWPAGSPFLEVKTLIPTKNNEGRSVHRLAKQPGGNRCIYLNAENRCAIHAAFGEAAKPAACRAFPRLQVALAGEQFMNYSLACRCARLVPFGQLLELIEPDLPVPFHAKPAELKLESGKSVLAVSYRDWCGGFLSFFQANDLTAAQAIAAAYRFTELTLTGEPNAPSAGVLRSAVAQSLPAKIPDMHFNSTMDVSQRSLFFQILYYSLNPGPVEFYEWSKAEQERIKVQRLAQGEAFRDELNSPLILNEPLATTFQAVRAVASAVNAQDLKNTFGAFLCAKLVGLRFHSDNTQPFPISVHLLLLSCAEILWTAKAFAAHESQPAFDQTHLEKALRLVDSSIGTLTLSMFPKNVAEAWRTIFTETTFAVTAVKEMLLLNEEFFTIDQ